MAGRRKRVNYGPGNRPPYHINERTETECCAACGKEHAIMAGTWVILASGAFVCSNDQCWRTMANWYKEKEHAERMDGRTAQGAVEEN